MSDANNMVRNDKCIFVWESYRLEGIKVNYADNLNDFIMEFEDGIFNQFRTRTSVFSFGDHDAPEMFINKIGRGGAHSLTLLAGPDIVNKIIVEVIDDLVRIAVANMDLEQEFLFATRNECGSSMWATGRTVWIGDLMRKLSKIYPQMVSLRTYLANL